MEALFGGSFDPVHVGHLVAAEAAGEALAARVRFVPARVQPLKRAAHEAGPEQRAEMLDLAVAGNPRLTVERIELALPAPSYTVRTLQALAEREPGNRFTLLLGADAAAAHQIGLDKPTDQALAIGGGIPPVEQPCPPPPAFTGSLRWQTAPFRRKLC